MGDNGRYRAILGDIGRYWAILGDIGGWGESVELRDADVYTVARVVTWVPRSGVGWR